MATDLMEPIPDEIRKYPIEHLESLVEAGILGKTSTGLGEQYFIVPVHEHGPYVVTNVTDVTWRDGHARVTYKCEGCLVGWSYVFGAGSEWPPPLVSALCEVREVDRHHHDYHWELHDSSVWHPRCDCGLSLMDVNLRNARYVP